jgi:hypothetical protein
LFESGRRRTLYDIRAWLRFADAVDMPRAALLPMMLGRADAWLADADVADAVLASAAEETGLDVDRRTFGGLAVGAAAAIVVPEIAVPARVTAAHVRYLRTCADNPLPLTSGAFFQFWQI